MPLYLRAYQLQEVRRFSAWKEKTPSDEPLADDSIVYLREDLTVTSSCFDDADSIYDDVTPEWTAFCGDELGFKVPDWDAESERVRAELSDDQSDPASDEDGTGAGES